MHFQIYQSASIIGSLCIIWHDLIWWNDFTKQFGSRIDSDRKKYVHCGGGHIILAFSAVIRHTWFPVISRKSIYPI